MAKEIYLYSPIYDFVAESVMKQMNDYMDESVDLRVNSPGGNVMSGWGILAKMQEHGKVNAKIDGDASSMAVFIPLFAASAECLDVSGFTFHRAAFPSWYTPTPEEQTSLDNTNKDLRAKMLSKLDSEAFKTETGYSIEDLFTSEKRIDVEINAKTAKKIGLVQKITKLTPAEVTAYKHRMAAFSAPKEDPEPKPNKIMTPQELKEKYPEASAALVKSAVDSEKERVAAWLTYNEIDAAAVTKGITEGTSFGQLQMAEFGKKMFAAAQLGGLNQEGVKPLQVPGAPVTETPEAEAKKKALAEFEAAADAKLHIVK